jgi:hypothetical protein
MATAVSSLRLGRETRAERNVATPESRGPRLSRLQGPARFSPTIRAADLPSAFPSTEAIGSIAYRLLNDRPYL